MKSPPEFPFEAFLRRPQGNSLDAPEVFGNLAQADLKKDQKLVLLPIDVPAKQGIRYGGYQLTEGTLPLGNAFRDFAILITAPDFSQVHIDTSGKMVIKKNGVSVEEGKFLRDDSSPLDNSTVLQLHVLQNGIENILHIPKGADIIIYKPQGVKQYTRREKTNISTSLLRQFLT